MRTEIDTVVLNSTGHPVAGASVQVDVRGGAAATVYSGETGPAELTNPLTSDSSGRVNGWLERGAYVATISHATIDTFTENFESAPGKDASIDSAWIAPNAVTTAKIADAQVTTAKLADGAATAAKIGAGAVTTAKLAANAVTTSELADDAVTAAKIAANAVGTSEIADASVTPAKLSGGGSSIPQTIIDAKGDLIVGTAADTPARKAVGADGSILTSDSTKADGLDWRAPTGWVDMPGAWSFGAADGHSFTMTSTTADYTGLISLGMKMRLVQSATTKYFFVTKIAFAGSTTTITLYGGTDYTLANSAISAVYYSMQKAPFGFPLSPAKWTESVLDSSDRTKNGPTTGTWYAPGVTTMDIPIGVWDVYFGVSVHHFSAAGVAGTGTTQIRAALSTSTSSVSDSELQASCPSEGRDTDSAAAGGPTVPSRGLGAWLTKLKPGLELTAKTTYRIIVRADFTQSSGDITAFGSKSPNTIKAVCAYL